MDQCLIRPVAAVETSQRLLDVVERFTVVVLYVWLAYRIFAHFDGRFTNVLPLLSEGLVVVYVAVRRPTNNISKRPSEWFLALGSTCAPLLVAPAAYRSSDIPLFASMLWLTGMLIQIHAKIVLGRSFGLVPAHRGLKISGPYRLVRHPMYAGYLLTHIAFLALSASLWNLAVYVACYAMQVPRLLAEERLLSRDPLYRQYAERVKYRLLPRVF